VCPSGKRAVIAKGGSMKHDELMFQLDPEYEELIR
jgi:hypothetical protein